MRKTDSTRRVLRDVTVRDSLDSKIALGILTEPYQGGSSATISIDGVTSQVAVIPRALLSVTRAPRSYGSPVTVRFKRGVAQVISWGDDSPFLEYGNSSTSQSIVNSTDVQVGFQDDDIVYDTLSIIDVDNSRITMPSLWEGLWLIEAHFKWQANSSGARKAWIYLNGSELIGDKHDAVDSSTWWNHLSFRKRLVESDKITFWVRQNSGSSLTLTEKHFYMEFVRG